MINHPKCKKNCKNHIHLPMYFIWSLVSLKNPSSNIWCLFNSCHFISYGIKKLKFPKKLYSFNKLNGRGTIGMIRGQVGVDHEIVYEALGFNRLTGLGVASAVNLLNHLGFIDYFMINTSCPLIIPIIYTWVLLYENLVNEMSGITNFLLNNPGCH